MKNSQRKGAARPDKCAALRARIEHEIAWDDRTYHLFDRVAEELVPAFHTASFFPEVA